MKNAVCVLILFSFNSLFSQSSKTIIGEWNAIDTWENKSKFIFSEDGYISMMINNEFVDGRNFIIRGRKNNNEKAEIKYSVDYTKNPIEIDIIALKNEDGKPKEYGRMLCILKFVSNDETILIISMGKRDLDFNTENKDRIIKLSRQN